MQNAPAMLAQKMMNRQAAYAPVGMVSQNMSGNKKSVGGTSSGPVIGLKFDTATATAGVTFSNSNTTAINSTGGSVASAKANATTSIGVSVNYYWEFIIAVSGSARLGVGLSSFVCNASNQVGNNANEIAYSTDGFIFGGGSNLGSVSTATTGDVIGFKLDLTASSSTLTILKNGTVILSSYNSTPYVTGYASAWVPIWSSQATLLSATISNNIYSYAGYTPIGTSVTTVGASASVPAVADGKYDVYTFNASGTFTATSTGAVRALVIAGGGGGGNTSGGGAGGYKENGATVTPQTYTITVGAGGGWFASGSSSSIGSLISTVGGGGGNSNIGGSGSGGSPSVPGPDSQPGGAGTAGQGFAGGTGNSNGVFGSGGAGGGAGGVGGAGISGGSGGNGGPGVTSSITGTSIGRGGGGGGWAGGTVSDGGAAGPSDAVANKGGGGGGNGGAGGSGVVIIRVRARV